MNQSQKKRKANQAFYHSKEWKHCRDAYLSYCGGLCERCKAKGIITPAYVVHHKIYLDGENINNPDISLNFSNLEALCFTCHNQEHFKSQSKRRWEYVDGVLVVKE